MKAKKILFINQEISPYISENPVSLMGRYMPQSLQQNGCEIRTFMPRWGCINERRNQLHEVIRLSGMNIIIEDTDHPLIIKVASIQSARMQVYFIDNDEYFRKRGMLRETENDEHECADNFERSLFFCRGVLETVKKLCWIPDLVVCQGWMAALAPYLIREVYKEEPPFMNARVVYVAAGECPQEITKDTFTPILIGEKAHVTKAAEAMRMALADNADDVLGRFAVNFADVVAVDACAAHTGLKAQAEKQGKQVVQLPGENAEAAEYVSFFDAVG